MILDKALLLKGLAGVTALGGTVTVGVVGHQKGLWPFSKKNAQVTTPAEADPEANTLISSVGLTCTSSNTEETCTTTTGGTLKLKQENNTSENITLQSSSAKIFLYRSDSTNTYKANLKFVIEGGDITLTGGESSSITKLEEFETYQIEKSGDKWYLSRKEKAADEIRRTLGLPEGCSFSGDNTTSKTCTIPSTDINSIDFLGKSGTVTNTSSSSLSLTITKVSEPTNYPLGYKFSFQASESEVSVSTSNNPITFKTNESTEFKINRSGNRNKDLKLEKALTLEDLLKEVGLSSCTTSNSTECSIGNSGIKVKQDTNKKEESKTKSSGSGKIKVYSDSTYNKGFRFVIEEGDITLSSGTISKLEEFETYEIVKEENENKWFFSRKKKSTEEKKRLLGLPTSCNLPEENSTSSECCDVTKEQLKTINFEGKPEGNDISTSGTTTLTITKTTENSKTDFPLGFKFAIKPSQDLTIPQSSGTDAITIKTNIATEFKIKKNSASNLTLEKAWTVESLAKKIGISSCNKTNKECTFQDNATLNLFISSSDTKENATIKDDSKNKKIKYEEDVEGYNQGFKFYVDEDITLTCTNGGDGGGTEEKKIEKKNDSNSPTYQIKEEGGKWYLVKKE